MEVRFTVDDNYIRDLQKDSQSRTAAEVVKKALTLYRWALSEVRRERVILSSDELGQNVQRVVMPGLESHPASQKAAAV